MTIELSDEDARALRTWLQQKVVELDKEINRTDSLAFKQELHALDRSLERVLGQLTSVLEGEPTPATKSSRFAST